MAMPVVTVASGGTPVVDVSSTTGGIPVTEASRGLTVTKVTKYGLAVSYVAASFSGLEILMDDATGQNIIDDITGELVFT